MNNIVPEEFKDRYKRRMADENERLNKIIDANQSLKRELVEALKDYVQDIEQAGGHWQLERLKALITRAEASL